MYYLVDHFFFLLSRIIGELEDLNEGVMMLFFNISWVSLVAVAASDLDCLLGLEMITA